MQSEVVIAVEADTSIYEVRGRPSNTELAGPYTVETKQIETVDNDCVVLGLNSSLSPR
jgi:hypothetical protein